MTSNYNVMSKVNNERQKFEDFSNDSYFLTF